MWEVEYEYIEDWLDEQDDETVASIFAALELLSQTGPTLGRPIVDTIQGSNVKNMKELRPPSPGRTEIRILFAFDPARSAIMLLAGDKAQGKNSKRKWSGWYKTAIPTAEQVYTEHLSRMEARNNGRS